MSLLVGGLFLVRALLNCVFTFGLSLRHLFRKKPVEKITTGRGRFFVILPVLEESRLIASKINSLKSTIDWTYVEEVIVVGNARERDDRGINCTIAEAEKAAANDRRFRIFECAVTEAIKAHQINFALDYITKFQSTSERPAYVLIIDIDSVFTQSIFNEAAFYCDRGAKAMQQHAIFTLNFESLDFIQKCHALYQSRWTISHEIKNNFLYCKTRWFLSHIVGHGFIGESGLLEAVGGIPTSTISEDLHLGYYLTCIGEPIISLATLEKADMPTTLREGMRQQKAWAFGAAAYPLYLRAFQRDQKEWYRTNILRSYAMCVWGMLSFLHWLLLFPGVLTLMVLAVEFQGIYAAALGTYLIELSIVAIGLWSGGYVRKRYAVFGALMMLVHLPFRSLAALRMTIDLALGSPVVRHKTAHR